jgi:hypothetical protein
MNDARELSLRLSSLLRNEQRAMADFLVALSDFDQRKLWRDLGHASLFSYLRRELGLSAGAAQYRKTAAELIQVFPQVESALRDGRLCLSSVVEVSKVLTPANCAEVLPRFFGLSRREAEFVAASIRPATVAPQREVVTMPRSAPALTLSAAAPAPSSEMPTPNATAFRPAETPPPNATPVSQPVASRALASAAGEPRAVPARDAAKPLDAASARLHVTVSRRFLDKLAAVRDALSHSHPGASTEELLEAGLDLLLDRRAKRNGLVAKPRNAARPSKTDAVPAPVKREVWKRAGGRCEWKLHSGERCGSTTRLEYDHITPRAHGGPSTIDNVRLACREHNLLAARQVFGDPWMDRFRRGVSSPSASSP